MKRILLTLFIVAIITAVGFVAAGYGQNYNISSQGQGGGNFKYAMRSHPLNATLIGLMPVDSLVATIDGKTITFSAPFTCLLDSVRIQCDKDSVAFADTVTNYWNVYVLCGTSFADTAYSYTGAGNANRLKVNTARYLTKSTTKSKRYLTAGEMYQFKIVKTSTPTTIPRTLTATWNLVAPDK